MTTIKTRSVLRLDERSAQEVILVQAAETTDSGGRWLSHGARRQATETYPTSLSGAPVEDEAAALAARARALMGPLVEALPDVERWQRWSRLPDWLPWPVALLGLVAGAVTQGLGSDRYISILAVPLMALVVWNVAVLVLAPVLRRLPWKRSTSWAERLWGAWRERAARRLRKSAARRRDEADGPSPADMFRTFADAWGTAQRPLALARLRRLLHLGSLSLVIGAVLGMYGRGLVREYRVAWESTFLSGEQVDALLSVVLAPAARLLGRDVPSVATYPWPETFDAAPFIHLWAVTAVLFVVLPRLVLFGWHTWRLRRLQSRLSVELPETYRRRLRSAGDTVVLQLDVWPYSYQPSSGALQQGKRLLLDAFGSQCNVLPSPPLDYGDLLDDRPVPRGRCVVVVFNLAQTPEAEVHGELLSQLKDQLAPGQSLAAWVDEGPYVRRQTDGVAAARLDDKRKAWTRLLHGVGLEPLLLDLESPEDDDLLRFDAVIWPPGSAGQGR